MTTRSLALIALLTAITVVLGLVPPIMLGFFPVPIHAQSLGVLLAGVVLGARGGALSVLLLLVLVALAFQYCQVVAVASRSLSARPQVIWLASFLRPLSPDGSPATLSREAAQAGDYMAHYSSPVLRAC